MKRENNHNGRELFRHIGTDEQNEDSFVDISSAKNEEDMKQNEQNVENETDPMNAEND